MKWDGKTMQTCPTCGKKMPEGNKFCSLKCYEDSEVQL